MSKQDDAATRAREAADKWIRSSDGKSMTDSLADLLIAARAEGAKEERERIAAMARRRAARDNQYGGGVIGRVVLDAFAESLDPAGDCDPENESSPAPTTLPPSLKDPAGICCGEPGCTVDGPLYAVADRTSEVREVCAEHWRRPWCPPAPCQPGAGNPLAKVDAAMAGMERLSAELDINKHEEGRRAGLAEAGRLANSDADEWKRGAERARDDNDDTNASLRMARAYAGRALADRLTALAASSGAMEQCPGSSTGEQLKDPPRTATGDAGSTPAPGTILQREEAGGSGRALPSMAQPPSASDRAAPMPEKAGLFVCEQHPRHLFGHGDCPGPGMPAPEDVPEEVAREFVMLPVQSTPAVAELLRARFGGIVKTLELVASEPCVLHWAHTDDVRALENAPTCACYPCRSRRALDAARGVKP